MLPKNKKSPREILVDVLTIIGTFGVVLLLFAIYGEVWSAINKHYGEEYNFFLLVAVVVVFLIFSAIRRYKRYKRENQE